MKTMKPPMNIEVWITFDEDGDWQTGTNAEQSIKNYTSQYDLEGPIRTAKVVVEVQGSFYQTLVGKLPPLPDVEIAVVENPKCE